MNNLDGIFPERLRALRKAKNVDQKTVGNAIGSDQRVYRRYETGERFPRLDVAVMLANYFGVSLDYLCGLSDSPERML